MSDCHSKTEAPTIDINTHRTKYHSNSPIPHKQIISRLAVNYTTCPRLVRVFRVVQIATLPTRNRRRICYRYSTLPVPVVMTAATAPARPAARRSGAFHSCTARDCTDTLPYYSSARCVNAVCAGRTWTSPRGCAARRTTFLHAAASSYRYLQRQHHSGRQQVPSSGCNTSQALLQPCVVAVRWLQGSALALTMMSDTAVHE